MERNYKVMVFLENVKAEDDSEESLREAIRESLRVMLDAEDYGHTILDYSAEELEE